MPSPREFSPETRRLFVQTPTDFPDGSIGGGHTIDQNRFHDAKPALATIYGPSKMRVDSLARIDENNLTGLWTVTTEACKARLYFWDSIEMENSQRMVVWKTVAQSDVEDHFRPEIGYAFRAIDQIGQVVDMVEYLAKKRGIDSVAQLVGIDSATLVGNTFGALKLKRKFQTEAEIRHWDEENRVKIHAELTARGVDTPTTVLDLAVKLIPKPQGLYLRNEELLEALVQLGIAAEFETRVKEFPVFEIIGQTTLPKKPLVPKDVVELVIEVLQRRDDKENDRFVIKGNAFVDNEHIVDNASMQGSFQPWSRAVRMLRPAIES